MNDQHSFVRLHSQIYIFVHISWSNSQNANKRLSFDVLFKCLQRETVHHQPCEIPSKCFSHLNSVVHIFDSNFLLCFFFSYGMHFDICFSFKPSFSNFYWKWRITTCCFSSLSSSIWEKKIFLCYSESNSRMLIVCTRSEETEYLQSFKYLILPSKTAE